MNKIATFSRADLADAFDALADDMRPLFRRLDDICGAADPAMRHAIDYDPALFQLDDAVLRRFASRIRAGEFSNQQAAE